MESLRSPLLRALTKSQSTAYICTSCRSQLRCPTAVVQQRRYASKQDLPLTERVRRKIWGTDNPPGLADPYGGPSFLEKRRMRREAAQREAAGGQEQYSQNSTSRVEPATEIDEVEQREPAEYVEARTWDGLQHIGHLGDWRDLAPQPEDQYNSWLESTSLVARSRGELLSCLHQAFVECLACSEAQIPPETTLMFDPSEVDTQVYASTKIASTANGLETKFESENEREHLFTFLQAVGDGLTETDANTEDIDQDAVYAESATGTQPMEQAQLHDEDIETEGEEADYFGSQPLYIGVTHYEVSDEAFLTSKLDLQDHLSFTILKRFSQLSGHRIPDPILNATGTGSKPLSHLLDALCESIKPKPKNLAEILMQKQNLTAQGNVWVMPRRETPVDRQKEVGRWKVIERELKERGLPVLGKLQS